MRAVAVLSVIAFHAFPEVVPGGFVGVDVFFVISGFLITGILQREIADGTFSITAFYARRVKRLFPALVLVLAVTLAIGWAVLLNDEYRQLGRHMAAGAGFVSNIVLWGEAGYFDLDSGSKPLLHLWSLGVEEQFYILWPLVLALSCRYRVNLLMVLGALGLASFAANIMLVDTHPAAAFFLPYPRFWELMLGGLLAAAVPLSASHPPPSTARGAALRGMRLVLGTAALAGLIAIGLAISVITVGKRFPGWWAVLPTLGAAPLIGAGPRTWMARQVMSYRPLVLVGLISYPLYLWHWPLLTFARIIYAGLPPLAVRIAVVGATFFLAYATYRYVELPMRDLGHRARHAQAVLTGLGTALLGVFLAGIMVSHGIPSERIRDLSVALSAARGDWFYPGDAAAVLAGTSAESVLFFGDSYVQQLYPRMKFLAGQDGAVRRTVVFHTAGGCAPVPGIARRSVPECIVYSARGFERAADPEVTVVVIGGSWRGMLGRGDYYHTNDPQQRTIDFQDRDHLNTVLERLEGELVRLKSMGKAVYVVLNPPGGVRADPGALEGGRMGGGRRLEVKSIPLSEHRSRTAVNEAIAAVAQRAGVSLIDPAGWLCSEDRCAFTDAAGVPYFKDATHLRASFVRCCVKDFDHLVITGQ